MKFPSCQACLHSFSHSLQLNFCIDRKMKETIVVWEHYANDEIPVEVIKLINDDNRDVLHKLFNEGYDTGIYPDYWLKSSLVKIPKKNNAGRC